MKIRKAGIVAAVAAAVWFPVVAATAADAAPASATVLPASDSGYPCPTSPGPWTLHTSALNIRASASTSSTIVGILYKGQKWRVNSYTKYETWVNITDLTTGVRGWVSGKYLYRDYYTCY